MSLSQKNNNTHFRDACLTGIIALFKFEQGAQFGRKPPIETYMYRLAPASIMHRSDGRKLPQSQGLANLES
jgi:hypothetical protein